MAKMGLKGSSTCELFFDGCRIPADACLGGEGNGFALSMESVVTSRISAAAQGVGHAVGAFRAAVAWASAKGLLERKDAQAVHFRLASVRAEIAAARTLLHAVAKLVDGGGDVVADVSMAKLRCTEVGMAVAAEAVDLLGPEGDLARWGAERRFRDAKVAQIYDGTNEIQHMLIARDVRRRAEGG